jgi:uracil-DNA glycosylase
VKPLLIGQAPSRITDGKLPFSGRSGLFLARLLGIEHEQLSELFELRNLIARWPGKDGKGDLFPLAVARLEADAVPIAGRTVVLAGTQVATAFGVAKLDRLVWHRLRGAKIGIIPHPSGLNRWWNEPENRDAARRFLRSCL